MSRTVGSSAAAAAAGQAASNLYNLWNTKQHIKFLQAPPPAQPNSRLLSLFKQSMKLIVQSHGHLSLLLVETDTTASGSDAVLIRQLLLSNIMPYEPFATLGTIIMWIQSQPQLIDFTALAHFNVLSVIQDVSYSSLWLLCIGLVNAYVDSSMLPPDGIFAQESPSAQLAAEARDQLDSTGVQDSTAAVLDMCLRRLVTTNTHVACHLVHQLLLFIGAPYRWRTLYPVSARHVKKLDPVLLQVQKIVALLKLPQLGCSGSAKTSSVASSSKDVIAVITSDRWEADLWNTIAALQGALIETSVELALSCSRCLYSTGLSYMAEALDTFRQGNTTAGVLLQLLTVHCRTLHSKHPAGLSQQQQQQPGSPRLLGSSYLNCCYRAHLLPVAAAHQQCKQLVPCEQYVLSVQKAADMGCTRCYQPDGISYYKHITVLLQSLKQYAKALAKSGSEAMVKLSSSSPLLQPVSVHLILELLLLTAREEHMLLNGSSTQLPQQQQGADQQPLQDQYDELFNVAVKRACIQQSRQHCLAILRHQMYLLAAMQRFGNRSKERHAVLESCGPQLLKVVTHLLMHTTLEAERADGSDEASKQVLARRSIAQLNEPSVLPELSLDIYDAQAFNVDASSDRHELLLLLCALSEQELHALGADAYPPSAMTALAASHPVQYFSMVEACFRAQLEPIDALIPLQLLKDGVCQNEQQMLQLLQSDVATAAMGSAVCTAAKYWAVKAAAARQNKQQQHPAKSAKVQDARLHFGAVAQLPTLKNLLAILTHALHNAMVASNTCQRMPQDSPRSGSTTLQQQQLAASSLFMLVLVARSLQVLHNALPEVSSSQSSEAVDAPADALYLTKPGVAGVPAVLDAAPSQETMEDLLAGLGHVAALGFATINMVWQNWGMMLGSEMHSGSSSGSDGSSSRSGHCHSGQKGVRWGYLLYLGNSRKIKAASVAFVSELALKESRFPKQFSTAAAAELTPNMSIAEQKTERAYHAVLGRHAVRVLNTLTAVAPLPVVCNNLQCSCLKGFSEATTAVKECSGCGARYCSVQCQQQDWVRHKKACRRIADAGWAVNYKMCVSLSG